MPLQYKTQQQISDSIEDDEKEETETTTDVEDSISSLSVLECVNELKKRGLRRISTQSHNTEDLDLINQNKHNKEQERKCKPCKNGFCYCFTSDSGDPMPQQGNSIIRPQRRSRKSEIQIPQLNKIGSRLSAPARLNNKEILSNNISTAKTPQITAISRLETAPPHAPLIHIIQELHNNCVISEVRVNRHKIHSSATSISSLPKKYTTTRIKQQPTAPPLSPPYKPTAPKLEDQTTAETEKYISLEESAKPRARHRLSGKLLEKRLGKKPLQYHKHNHQQPPPKPPRTQAFDEQRNSISTLASTTPSIREAEAILDEFLRKRGVVIKDNVTKNKNKRQSYPLSSSQTTTKHPLPTCPSLSDIEQILEQTQKPANYYKKNLQKVPVLHKSLPKELSFGWVEPKVNQGLKTSNAVKSQARQAEAETGIGWKPPHKVQLDTVDGVGENLDSYIGRKKTPLKSNLKCSQLSKDFIKRSKRRILRLVSPKKGNQHSIHTEKRTIGVQTSREDMTRLSTPSVQSPPGSYHSPLQSSITHSSNNSQPTEQFDFTRLVLSPPEPKKVTRKLNFPQPKSYRSFQKDLNQDDTFARMGYMLSNIRARLEASDENAVRTFQEIERREQLALEGYDCVDGQNKNINCTRNFLKETSAEIHDNVVQLYQRATTAPSFSRENRIEEPIYSEIEEESIVITGSPQVENKMGIKHYYSKKNPKALYAQVIKTPKRDKSKPSQTPPIALGQFLHNSLRSLVTKESSQHNLNNAEEQDSPPRPNRHLSKSDLSLQRSEIFLENLCRSELNLNSTNKLDNSFASASASYVLPDTDENSTYTETSHSTPKKNNRRDREISPEVFMTKTLMSSSIRRELEIRTIKTATSCPNTPSSKHMITAPPPSAACSLQSITTTQTRFKRLKNALRQSLRKSRKLVQFDKALFSRSLHLPVLLDTSLPNSEQLNCTDLDNYSYHLDTLFALDETAPVAAQIEQAVNLCRQLPQLEVSAEMVEAERLLLYANLPRTSMEKLDSVQLKDNCTIFHSRFYIDGLKLPVLPNASQDIFFNSFYIVTFKSNGCIRSTQSVECRQQQAVFTDCGLEFNMHETKTPAIFGDIFMLRLRKVSTLSLEPRRPFVKFTDPSTNRLISRFRLQASCQIHAENFIPYEYVAAETLRSEQICLRASHNCILPLIQHNKCQNLGEHLELLARVEIRFPKEKYCGLLNVQEKFEGHLWNQRWCVLEGIMLSIWRDSSEQDQQPLLVLDLRHSVDLQPMQISPRELCARQRSFALNRNNEIENFVFFSAENQKELNTWLEKLNKPLEFIEKWLIVRN